MLRQLLGGRDASPPKKRLAETYGELAKKTAFGESQSGRELQLIAIEHLPLLTGIVKDEGGALSVWGRAIARDGLHGSVRFFINGLPLEEVAYPVPEDNPFIFSEFGGITGFKATTREHRDTLMTQPWWRIDMVPFGTYRPHAWRSAWWFANPAFEKFAVPSAENMRRVIGDDDPARFMMGGLTIFQNVTQLMREMGREWNGVERVLDWGCGAGRITRYLLSEPRLEVHGADIDADNISWCASHLAPGIFTTIDPSPETPYAPEMFDIVVGASVMTHLTEDMQFAWLEELHRITKPGALLFLSVAGACQFAHMGIAPQLYNLVQEKGYVDRGRDPALDGFIPDADYYRAAWHSHRYIVEQWSRFFEVIAVVDGVAALQDFVVLRRR